jgi:hypothetical protein
MTNDYSKMSAADFANWLRHPAPPDDPDEDAEFEEVVYFENGKRLTVRRPNSKLTRNLPPAE